MKIAYSNVYFKLRDIWISKISKSEKPTRFDALSWLSRTTLDIIGVAGRFYCDIWVVQRIVTNQDRLLGFNYEFHNLKEDGKPNELNEAYKDLFSVELMRGFFSRLQFMIPILGYIVSFSEVQLCIRNNT